MTDGRYFCLILILICFGCSPKISEAIEEGWQPLLVDSTLSNFDILNGSAEYYVDGNVIVGVSKLNTPNTFLSTKEKYSDFILEFEVWADPLLNSGVQFRSTSDPRINEGRVHGYQVEIESSPRKWAGGIYDEGRRGWLYSLDLNPKAKDAFKVNEWNHYRIQAVGDEITTWVNKVQCTYLKDNLSPSGLIGFQIHSIEHKEQENKTVKWRNIRIKTTNLKNELWQNNTEVPLINKINNK